MIARDLMAKATQAVASARVLYDLGDADGACSRAYYAMFDAVRAVLATTEADSPGIKTHKGIHVLFHDRLVRSGLVPETIGRFLKRAETVRYAADFAGESVELEIAHEMIDQAEVFVTTMKDLLDKQDS